MKGNWTGPSLRGGTFVLLVAAMSLGAVPAALLAQAGGGGGGGTMRRSTSKPAALNKVCAELASAPSALVHDPKGRALLGLKKDLEGAASAIESRGDPAQRMVEFQRMADVRRGVDSLIQVVVRTMQDDSGKMRTYVTVVPSRGAASGDVAAARGGTISPQRMPDRAQHERAQVEARIRSLEPQIAALMVAGSDGATRIPMPTGWMGVYLSRSAREVPTPEGMLTYYCEYPVIEAVNAGSPAEKGGLLAGDTLVAYNGRDVTSAAVNLTTLLVPNSVVRVRYKRDGRTRDVPLTIVPRPASQERVAFQRIRCNPSVPCEPGAGAMIVMDSLGGTRFDGIMTRPTFRGGDGFRPLVTAGPMPVTGVDLVLRGSGIGVLMGAQLSVIDDELAQNMGVEPGILVLRSPQGSHAAEAGLKPGEVIRAVNGVPLRELTALSRALSVPGIREVKLTVSARGATPRIVVVRF